jgi:hypothetical protein
MGFEKKDLVIMVLGITISIIFFGVTLYFRSGVFK